MYKIPRLVLISTVENSPAILLPEYVKNNDYTCLVKHFRGTIADKRILSNCTYLLTHSPKMNTQVLFSNPSQIIFKKTQYSHSLNDLYAHNTYFSCKILSQFIGPFLITYN